MLKWFEYAHLPPHLRVVSMAFFNLAHKLVEALEPGPERTVALRKLLEAKDCFMRARVEQIAGEGELDEERSDHGA